MHKLISDLTTGWPGQVTSLRSIGMDLVQISRIADSLARFGVRFERKLFTQGELGYAQAAPAQAAERLAARFAAKEAAIKALGLSESGVSWRDLEVRRHPGGECDLVLHGRAAEIARRNGITRLLLSLSHDGEYAGAVVAALSDTAPLERFPESRS